MSDETYSVEQAMAVGSNAKARARTVTFVKLSSEDGLKRDELIKELAQLRTAVREARDIDADERDETVGVLLEAQRAAEAGDERKLSEVLKGAGRWVLGVAEKIGVVVASAALRQSWGLP